MNPVHAAAGKNTKNAVVSKAVFPFGSNRSHGRPTVEKKEAGRFFRKGFCFACDREPYPIRNVGWQAGLS